MLDEFKLNDAGKPRVTSLDRGEAYPTIRSQIYCRDCKRPEFHFLGIRSAPFRALVKIFSLGLIGLVGTYRCRCCGNKRIGRFDFVRGPEKPKRPVLVRRRKANDDSFQFEQRRNQLSRFLQKINPMSWYWASRDSWKSVQRRNRWRRFFAGMLPFRKIRNRRIKKRRNW